MADAGSLDERHAEGEREVVISKATSYFLWMVGSAWVSAAAAGLAVTISHSTARWLFIFAAVFNGIYALYWAMLTVATTTNVKESDDE